MLYMPVHLHHLLNQASKEERIVDTWDCVLKYIWEKKLFQKAMKTKIWVLTSLQSGEGRKNDVIS